MKIVQSQSPFPGLPVASFAEGTCLRIVSNATGSCWEKEQYYIRCHDNTTGVLNLKNGHWRTCAPYELFVEVDAQIILPDTMRNRTLKLW